MERLSNDQQLTLVSDILEEICPPSLYSVILVHSSTTDYDALLPHVEYEYYRFQTSHTGAEVLAALTEQPVDLLIIAEDLDDMKGIELLKHLRTITTELPVIFIAETGSDALAGQVWKLSAEAYLTRPIEASMFSELIEYTIRARKRVLEIQECLYEDKKMEPFTVSDIFLISTTGKLLYHHSDHRLKMIDDDIFSGMFTAIRTFFDDSFKHSPGQLRTIDYKTFKILLESAPEFYLIAIGKGEIIEPVRERIVNVTRQISDRYGKLITSWTGNLAALDPVKQELTKIIKM